MASNIHTDTALVMRTEHGRRLIKHILDISGCDAVTFTGEYGQDCFDRGKQAMGLKVKNLVKEADFDLYLTILRESHDAT